MHAHLIEELDIIEEPVFRVASLTNNPREELALYVDEYGIEDVDSNEPCGAYPGGDDCCLEHRSAMLASVVLIRACRS